MLMMGIANVKAYSTPRLGEKERNRQEVWVALQNVSGGLNTYLPAVAVLIWVAAGVVIYLSWSKKL